jgi:hypothetical protein
MGGDEHVASWIANKLKDDKKFSSVDPIGDGFLEVAPKDHVPFQAVAIGVQDVIGEDHVAPLFEVKGRRPEFVVNVPSKAIWAGAAIDLVHATPAAFGTFGELIRASTRDEPVHTYRNKEYSFFERAFRQHTAVREVTRLYDKAYELHPWRGLPKITVVLVDAYDVSAEDIRRVRDLYGKFDAAVKMTSYGSITTASREAADSIGAGVFKFGEFLGRLNKP